MFFRYELVNGVRCKNMLDILNTGIWIDGKHTGSSNKKQKDNEQITDDTADDAWKLIFDCLGEKKEVVSYMSVRHMSPPLFTKYEEGMHYAEHVDSAYMNGIRSDYSTTLFLNDPDEYEGGELCLMMGTETLEYKLPKGWAISYPTGTRHRVNKITSGCRKVCIWWSQSWFRDQIDRNLWYQNCRAKEALIEKHPNCTEYEDEYHCLYSPLNEQGMDLMRHRSEMS